jgi:hypothetical protein
VSFSNQASLSQQRIEKCGSDTHCLRPFTINRSAIDLYS